MKHTPFTNIHRSLGAKMVEFAGYEMPVIYTSIQEEHQAVRENVGVFDVSHMGEFVIKGPGAADLVQKVTSNDVSKLSPGKAQYSCLPNNQGGIVDDLIVYALEGGNFMLVVNALNIEKDWQWIRKHNTDKVEMHDISDKTALLAVQGPNAGKVLQQLTDVALDEIGFYNFKKGTLAGIDNVLISATGYTGSGGFELYFDAEHAERIWNAIFDAGKEFNTKPCGLAARDTLRLEMGFCLYGNDINDVTSPLEAGLGWITKMTDGNDFPGREVLQQQKQEGIQRKLVGFELMDKGIPRHGYKIYDESGKQIGEVTSGTQGPSVKKAIGLGYVEMSYLKEGSEIFISVRDKMLKAQVVKLPFYKQS